MLADFLLVRLPGLSGAARQILFPTRCFVTASTEEAGQSEKVAEVIPGSAVVDLVDAEIVPEQRHHKHNRRNKALPEAEPEARDYVLVVDRPVELVNARRTSRQHVQQ